MPVRVLGVSTAYQYCLRRCQYSVPVLRLYCLGRSVRGCRHLATEHGLEHHRDRTLSYQLVTTPYQRVSTALTGSSHIHATRTALT
eukprot:1041711-Rhodomonas_salina.1